MTEFGRRKDGRVYPKGNRRKGQAISRQLTAKEIEDLTGVGIRQPRIADRSWIPHQRTGGHETCSAKQGSPEVRNEGDAQETWRTVPARL